MSDKITNTQDRPEEKPLTEQELQFCNLYVNGGLEYAGQPKKCFVEVFGEDTVKNPYASANYLMNKPHVLAHIKALLYQIRKILYFIQPFHISPVYFFKSAANSLSCGSPSKKSTSNLAVEPLARVIVRIPLS